MSEWRETTLDGLCAEGGGFVRTGPFGSQLHRSDYIADTSATPVVMPKDMVDGRIDQLSVARVSDETADRLGQHLLTPGDVVLSRRGDVGRSVSIRSSDLPALCGTGSIRIHLGSSEAMSARYFEYFMRSKHVVDYLEGQAVGATMPNLNAGIVNSLPVSIPPRGHQDAVADILGSIDDLMENNRRRIEVLEEMAQAIYREWFVHFRYPGHEDATFIDSTLGPIPEGWEVRPFGSLVQMISQTVDPTQLDPETPAVGLEHMPRRRLTLDTWGHASELGSRKAQFAENDLLFGKIRPYFHKVCVAPFEGIGSTDVIVLRPLVGHWGLAVSTAFSDSFVDIAAQTANGTKMPRANWTVMAEVRLAVPPAQLSTEFSSISRHSIGTGRELMRSNRRLASIRDLLLPKLVTGEIDVSSLDLDALIGAA